MFVNLLDKPRYDHAGEIFAYSRWNLIAGAKMKSLVRQLLEHPLVGEDLIAFMEQLAAVEPQLARTQVRSWGRPLERSAKSTVRTPVQAEAAVQGSP